MRILIVKLSSLGDVVQTLPVLKDIERVFPDARVDWVVEEAFADLLRSLPALDRVLVCAQRRWRRHPFDRRVRQEYRTFVGELREQAYDVVVDCQGLIKSAWVARQARLCREGFSVTFANRSELCSYEWPVRLLLDRSVAMPWRIHAVARTRHLVASALSYSQSPFLSEPASYPFIAKSDQSERSGVWLAHGTTREDNRWPRSHWIGLGKRLIESGEPLFLPHASATELDWAQGVAAELGAGVQTLPRLDLGTLWLRMAQAKGVISVDSGLGHLAVGLNLPTVQLFSQDRIRRAGPVGRAHQRAVGGDHTPSVEEVWQAWSSSCAAEISQSLEVGP